MFATSATRKCGFVSSLCRHGVYGRKGPEPLAPRRNMSFRVGLIGAGGIARAHLPAWLALGADVTVHSVAGQEALVAECGGTVVDSLDDLLAACDVVDIVTPTPTHRELAERALRAGKDVVCEKPLGRTPDDAKAIVDLAAGLGRQVYPGHVVRFFPEYAAMHRAVADSVIGTPAVARFTRTGSFPQWAAWFADDAQSGGVVFDLMIHDLDIARWTMGEVTEVYATAARDRSSSGVEVSVAEAVLTHEGGAISYVRAVWGPPGTTFWTSFNVAGDGGVLRHDTRDEKSFRLDGGASAAEGAMLPDLSFVESPYLTELREFASAFAGGPTPRVTGEDGAIAVRLAAAVQASIELGRGVAFGEEAVR
nr:Gfo/Idh/MocA family oxidoreductase [Tessaracoccus sp.]